MNCRGTTPPTILSTNSNPAAPDGSGSTSIWQIPNSPWPPVCLTFRPSPRAEQPTVSRSGTRSDTVSTATPYRDDSRSSSTSEWASPIDQSTSWWVSAFISSRMVGSSATSRASAVASLSSSAFDRATNATGSSGSGIDHGSISSGCSFDESVSPVSAVDSFATAHTEPAWHEASGRCTLPSGEVSAPIFSSSS